MSSVMLLKEIMNKTSLTVEKLATRANIDEKTLTDFLSEKTKLDIEDYMKISQFFNLSLDTLVTGKPTEHDKYTISKLEPSGYEVIEEYLEKCKKIITESGLEKHADKLLPKAQYAEKRGTEYFSGFIGGVFLNDEPHIWKDAYTPYICIEAVLALDDYDIYTKLKDYPRTFGQLRYKLTQMNDQKGLKATEPKNRSSSDWTRMNAVPALEFKDIANLTDVRFYHEVNIENKESTVLYSINPNNKSYWKIIDLLLVKGAYLVKGNLGDSWGPRKREEMIDYPATEMLRFIASKNLE